MKGEAARRCEFAEVDIYGAANASPVAEIGAPAVRISQGVAYVVEVEVQPSDFQALSFSVPVAEEILAPPEAVTCRRCDRLGRRSVFRL